MVKPISVTSYRGIKPGNSLANEEAINLMDNSLDTKWLETDFKKDAILVFKLEAGQRIDAYEFWVHSLTIPI